MATLTKKIITTNKVAPAIGPFSSAVVIDRTMYISGQVALDRDGKLVGSENVQTQAKQVLYNIGEILQEAGCGFENVVKTTVLLADIKDLGNVNEIYKEYFSKNFPARAAYQVAALPLGALIEIEAIAVLGPLTEK